MNYFLVLFLSVCNNNVKNKGRKRSGISDFQENTKALSECCLTSFTSQVYMKHLLKACLRSPLLVFYPRLNSLAWPSDCDSICV